MIVIPCRSADKFPVFLVSLVIHGVCGAWVSRDEIPAPHIICKAIAVVVLAITWNFVGIHPKIAHDVLVFIIEASVQYRHYDLRISSRFRPGLLSVYLCEALLLTKIGIIGRKTSDAVLFNIFNIWIRFQAPNRVIKFDLFWDLDMKEIRIGVE